MIDDNAIYANVTGGVTIATGANPTVQRNRISRNGIAGVQIRDEGRGVVVNNDLTGNPEPWIVAESCLPYVRFTGNLT
jgi:parallel beta-helix repeat protein